MTGLEAAIGGILTRVLYLVLLVHIDLLAVVLWKVWRGDNVFDRLMRTGLLGTLIVVVLVLVALFKLDSIDIDVALGLVALGFIGIIAWPSMWLTSRCSSVAGS